jgi:hypothetical protein
LSFIYFSFSSIFFGIIFTTLSLNYCFLHPERFRGELFLFLFSLFFSLLIIKELKKPRKTKQNHNHNQNQKKSKQLVNIEKEEIILKKIDLTNPLEKSLLELKEGLGEANLGSLVCCYKIKTKKVLKENFKKYQNEIKKDCKIMGNAGEGNTNYLLHGTSAICNTYSEPWAEKNKKVEPCKEKRCSICNIIRNGFNLSSCKKNIQTLRYGNGHYLASDVSKALAYSGNCLMFLCKVVQGRELTTSLSPDIISYGFQKDLQNTYHSVLGNKNRDPNLYADEICVYNSHAILTLFLLQFYPP